MGRCQHVRASLKACFTDDTIAISELLEVNRKNMEREGRHIDAAPPPTELDMLSFILYMANHYGIIHNIL